MKYIVYIFLLVTLVYSCKKEPMSKENLAKELAQDNNIKTASYDQLKAEYNTSMRKIAKSLAKSLKSKEFRQAIKADALKKADGDFDIPYKNLFEKSISSEKLKFKEIMAKNFDFDSEDKDENEAILHIDKFTDNYKKLQLAVPKKCIEWDADNFIPVVVYLPADYSESQEQVTGFDQNGNEIVLSNKIAPDFPVIVVSQNERSDDNGDILSIYKNVKSVPIDGEGGTALLKPTGLTATASMTGIWITWNSYEDPTSMGIDIERNDGTGYVLIGGIAPGTSDYMDIQSLIFGKTYTYRIKARSNTDPALDSPYSASVSAMYVNKPPAPANFKVENMWANQMSLTWSNPVTNYFNCAIIIKRWITGISTTWEQIASLPGNINYYSDINLQYQIYPLNKYRYMVYYDGGGIDNTSDAAFDVSYNTQRTIGQPLYMTHIKVDDIGAIESWVYGAPEFVFTVCTMNSSSTAAITLQSKVTYEPALRGPMGGSVTYNDNVTMLDNWDKDFAMSVMSINIVEYDGEWLSAKMDLAVGVKAAQKIKETGEINVSAGGNVTLEFKNSDKNLGTAYVYYWEQPTIVKDMFLGVHAKFSNEKINGDF